MEKCLQAVPGESTSALDECLKRNAESLQAFNNMWAWGVEADPNHVPAWKKQKRCPR